MLKNAKKASPCDHYFLSIQLTILALSLKFMSCCEIVWCLRISVPIKMVKNLLQRMQCPANTN